MILNILVWIIIGVVCYFIYKKINKKIGDDPTDLTPEEIKNAKVNANKLPVDEKTVMELQLRQKYNVNLVAIKRGEHEKGKKIEKAGIINVPMPNTMIYEGDILMLAGSDIDLAKLPTWKSITKRKAALPDADEWKDKTGKLSELIR